MTSCEPSPHLTCKIKARSGDWTVEGKGRAESFRESGREKRRVNEERIEREEDRREVEGKWNRSTWPRETASCKGFHRWGNMIVYW